MTAGARRPVSNEQFVTEVAQRVLRALGSDASTSPLYRVDTRLRPHGASGRLVVTLVAFRAYFDQAAHAWERLALTRARVVFSTGGFGRRVGDAIRSILSAPVDPEILRPEVLAMRRKLEQSRGRKHLKRGIGGVADVEFIVQYLMLLHASRRPALLRSNLWDALDGLGCAGVLAPETHVELRDAYDFLRTVEARLRLIHNRGYPDVPEDPSDLLGLARRLQYDDPAPEECVRAFVADAARHASAARKAFERIIASPR
jgi:glutamate-ammonia-ligase adenylyltransferase